jgi:DNA repair ATPase RecN
MISQLKITDFQSHRKLDLNFSEGINTICGKTDVGKSAIVRALSLLCFNRPQGDAFVSWAEGSSGTASVLAVVDDKKVERRKGKENVYLIGKKEFKAVGTGVPEEVEALLNVGSINFQRQHDSPFWFSLSPGEVSRELNQIINLGLIDSTLSNIASELRKHRGEMELTKTRLETADKEVERLSWARKAAVALKRVEQIDAERVSFAQDGAKIDDLVREARKVLRERDVASEAILAQGKVLAMGEKLVTALDARKSLDALIGDIERERKNAERHVPDLSELERKAKEIMTEVEKRKALDELVAEIRRTRAEAAKAKQQEATSHKELEKLTGGKSCPVCGGTF